MKSPKTPASSEVNQIQIGGDHYKHSSIQHWDWAWAEQLDFYQYQITKYVSRWNRKNGLQDLEKAQHYLQKYMEVIKADQVKYINSVGTDSELVDPPERPARVRFEEKRSPPRRR